MIRTMIESPFRGETVEETRTNIIYAQECMRDSLARGEAPMLSHLLYTQIWDERPKLRALGIGAGGEWLQVCQQLVVYADLGVSPDMQIRIKLAGEMLLPVIERKLGITRDMLHRSQVSFFPQLQTQMTRTVKP